MTDQSKFLLIAGGGTGGHIYPALSIAQSFKSLNPSNRVEFVGTKRGLEKKIIPQEGLKLHFISVGPLNQVGFFRKLLTLLTIPYSIFQSIKLIKNLKPDVVLGVGGYSSGPVLLAAFLLRKQIFIFEPNSFPGLANRILGKFTKGSFINFESAGKYLKHPNLVGIPVRRDLLPVARQPEQNLRVLIFGGSQGAKGLNTTVMEAFTRGGPWLSKLDVVHQTGSQHFAGCAERYFKLGLRNVECLEFLYDMPARLAWADLVVCRAGASTLAELAIMGKAAILIPFPFAADNHQLKNAQELANRGAAIVVEQSHFSPERFISLIEEFLESPDLIAGFERKIKEFAFVDSALRVATSLDQAARLGPA